MKRVLLAALAARLFGCASEAPVTPGVTPPEDAAADTAVADTSGAAPFPVRRLPCVSRTMLARDLPPEQMGALEGELVSIITPTNKACPTDPDHLHLQIAVGDKRYDVAITIDSDFGAPVAIYSHKRPVGAVPPDGWAAATFDYNKDIGTPSADYQALAPDAMLARLQTELESAARVRIFGRSYLDGSGVHNVHRNGTDRDGVILIHHIDGGDRAIALRFASDVF
jgi:hypothetical protein